MPIQRVHSFGASIKPQVNNPDVVKFSNGWVCLKRTFVAESNSNYVIIGNFFANDLTKSEPAEYDPASDRAALIFYSIDDVYVGTRPRR